MIPVPTATKIWLAGGVSRFFAERGYALASAGRGENATTRLQDIREEARAIGFVHTLARIEEFL